MKAFFVKTLSSRKFWAAVASSVPFAIAQDWQAFAYVWMTYAGIQGTVDALGVLGSKRGADVNGGYSADRAVDPNKVRPPRSGSAIIAEAVNTGDDSGPVGGD